MYIAGTEYSLKHRAFEIYVAGCNEPHCPGCHNPELWDFKVGDKFIAKTIDQLIDKIQNADNMVENIWILGGEPLDQPLLFDLVTMARALRFSTQKPIWLFTRYELDEIDPDVASNFDYIKTGRYLRDEQSNHVEHGVTLATANQHIRIRGIDF